ncbi:MAG: PKD domain-containing protein [Imperialibacter sp.]|uniref:PKD domain-containing protein n=1 Tax=Imperialibacter sp. TaxID=2038411 RepID=UPI0032EE25C1
MLRSCLAISFTALSLSVATAQECVSNYNAAECIEIDVIDHGFQDPENYDFYWDFNDGQKGKGSKVEHCYEEPGDYTVKLTLVNKVTGAFYPEEMQLSVVVLPELHISWELPAQVRKGENFETSFFIDGESPGIKSIEWMVDGELASTTTNPVLQVHTPGVHAIHLKVITSNSLSLCKEGTIEVLQDASFKYATRFLRDGIHDVSGLLFSGNSAIFGGDTLSLQSVFFTPDDVNLTAEATAILKKNIEALGQLKTLDILIGSFTHSSGFYYVNREVSLKRSNLVKTYLIKHGVKEERIKIADPEVYAPLVNTCIYSKDCEFADASLNLRTDFKLIEEGMLHWVKKY